METLVTEVRSGGEVIGQTEYQKYDSVQEACDTMGESKVLDLVNVQAKTRSMNEFRQANQPARGTNKDLERLVFGASPETFAAIRSRALEIQSMDDKEEKSQAILDLCTEYGQTVEA
tara:strand:- start:92 stop:442 length:351 start_codon:yes stop_codon:yes gene_type:complete